ncbi:MAG: PQQ-binding-like beta-propeller repeat protein [Bdellovibrionales bacterium]
MIKFVAKTGIIVGLTAATLGCAQFKELVQKESHQKTFAMDKKWVRSTLLTDYLKFRVLHRFQPILFKDMVIQGNAVDGIIAYDRKTGQKIWKKKIENGVESGAVIHGNDLFFAAGDGYFHSVNVYNGKTNWVFPIRSEGTGTPMVHDGIVYFISGNNIAYALDITSGRQVWLYNRRSTTMLSIRGGSQPSVYKNQVLLGFNDGFLVSLDQKKGLMKWQKKLNSKKRFTDIDARPIVLDDRIYVASFDEALYCLDANTGQQIWRYDEGGYAAVSIDEDRVYFSTTQYNIVALDKSSGKKIWNYASENGYLTQPQLYKSTVVVGESDGALLALDAQSGKKLGDFFPGRGVTSSAAIDNESGDLFFISKEANLYHFLQTRLEETVGGIWYFRFVSGCY